ncbi:NAD(P)/FAD-dependent oxidoreductase [Sphingobium aromaticivastans]|uniref:flavin-containing monooxygenase n=1 Tax=Sphingobium aromaticivastans TaxID=1778665 RepID=UPI0030199FA2
MEGYMTADRQDGRKKALRFVVIGAGMAGILAGVKLKAAGRTNFAIYEKGHAVGGTWRENRYPGLTCDVPAHCYTYSFAPNPEWSAFFAPGPEIKSYFEGIVRDYGIREHLHLNSEVMSTVYDEASGKWKIELADGRTDEADLLIAATGVLHHPNIPDFEGIEDFKGHVFHSARWDDSASLDGARVGVVGSGSTGVQIVSALSVRSAHVVHLQRSPQWIMPVENFDYSEEQRASFRADPASIDSIRFGEEYWAGIRRFNKAIIEPESDQMHEIQDVVQRNLEESIKDPILRETLRPDYMAACKRLIYSPDYYEAVQRHTVAVDTGQIKRFVSNGIEMADGTVHELDTVVLATGFKADRFMRPMTVKGRNGADLDLFWDKRPTAYLAVSMPDFPNFFMLNGPTGPVGNFSLIDIAEQQWGYIQPFFEMIEEGKVRAVSASHDAMARYEANRLQAAGKTVFGSGCTSWYLDREGVPLTWPWSYDAFGQAMAAPVMEDFELS